ncbi:hypothetical protein [Microbacterium aerolatum]|uniref:Uncharacterized protein n=1 Tax=Microbacterium aerolatum TaxID=153731 RepID=A0A511ALQ3_9MICO|nr:hypothetical protein [Microbacterium aerolatum]GEK86807.1 hypothetical protein MAE01_19830 [Microbacterium aerolatum]GGB24928.1 hypothetical protein GCM10007198_14120 [Microbacterium aerolatum]
MSTIALPVGAPLCARQLALFMQAMPDAERSLSPTSREFRAALGRLVSATPLAVMLSRSEIRTATAYLRKAGVL